MNVHTPQRMPMESMEQYRQRRSQSHRLVKEMRFPERYMPIGGYTAEQRRHLVKGKFKALKRALGARQVRKLMKSERRAA